MDNIEGKIKETINELQNGRKSVKIDVGEDIQIILSRDNETLSISVSVPEGRGIGDIEKPIERGIGESISLHGTPKNGEYHGEYEYFTE